LHVLRKRTDGYHDIESVLLPIPLHDLLEAIVDPGLPANSVQYTRSGITIPGEVKDDLCMRAIDLLRRDHPLPGLRVHLHKVIPIGAGLGGGSSDGANMLLLLNDLLDLRIERDRLVALAPALGSDPPFFISDRAQLAEGRGEQLTPVDVDLRGHTMILVAPGIHVSTAEVYARTPALDHPAQLARIVAEGPTTWRSMLVNVMEPYVFHEHPEVGRIKHQLYRHGAVYASMSGSGSSVYGIFKDIPPEMSWPGGYRAWTFPL
jgi:4-diphosphocytidyl-2-C-methyl-D-erythritol kinase